MKILRCVISESDDNRLAWRVARSALGLSARQLARVKASNGLRLENESIHADVRVKAGQTLCAYIPEEPPEFRAPYDDGPVNIVYEDEDVLVIDKPAPLATQYSHRQEENALENRLSWYYRDDPNFVFRPVNRLDKGTSGLMCAAKNPWSQHSLTKLLHTDSFVREYLAVCVGSPAHMTGCIDLPIGKLAEASVKRVITADGAPSKTLYRVLSSHNELSLLLLRLLSGRTHQIRVHMSAISCPVYGDFLYGKEEPLKLPGRQALHCTYLSFVHPQTGIKLSFHSALSPEIAKLIQK
ncbi:MAG: RluA family pseudouridine synthase [Clostridiales bacterium]|nr:RluA family pseudouridine synthase [Clostridiales bacterium]